MPRALCPTTHRHGAAGGLRAPARNPLPRCRVPAPPLGAGLRAGFAGHAAAAGAARLLRVRVNRLGFETPPGEQPRALEGTRVEWTRPSRTSRLGLLGGLMRSELREVLLECTEAAVGGTSFQVRRGSVRISESCWPDRAGPLHMGRHSED
ncbi:hypothetical protein DFJ74DRAFT_684850 [Hyaloraphidium curvatum]|nr:hypothetical protein DFJ74DRAFT_684850 [Hyaloraphidium curvatum]